MRPSVRMPEIILCIVTQERKIEKRLAIQYQKDLGIQPYNSSVPITVLSSSVGPREGMAS